MLSFIFVYLMNTNNLSNNLKNINKSFKYLYTIWTYLIYFHGNILLIIFVYLINANIFRVQFKEIFLIPIFLPDLIENHCIRYDVWEWPLDLQLYHHIFTLFIVICCYAPYIHIVYSQMMLCTLSIFSCGKRKKWDILPGE